MKAENRTATMRIEDWAYIKRPIVCLINFLKVFFHFCHKILIEFIPKYILYCQCFTYPGNFSVLFPRVVNFQIQQHPMKLVIDIYGSFLIWSSIQNHIHRVKYSFLITSVFLPNHFNVFQIILYG